MLHAISPSLKKCKRDTCVVNDRAYAPPKRNHLMRSLTIPPYPHMKAKGICLLASTNLRRLGTPIKQVFPTNLQPSGLEEHLQNIILFARIMSSSFYFDRQQVHHGHSRCQQQLFMGGGTQDLSRPGHKPWSQCERQAMSHNTKSWATKHQWHTKRPLATPI